MKRIIVFFLIFPVLQIFASLPNKFDIESEDFLKGRFIGTSLFEEGIVLSLKDKRIESPSEEFYFSAISDSKGNIYIGTGHEGKLWMIDPKGKSTLLFDAPEMDILAIALDSSGNIYCATSPNGKIYKIIPDGKSSIFFDPEEKFIWDINFDERGNLYVACGEKAIIYRVSQDGSAKDIFTSSENHIFKVLPTKEGIIAGTGGEGLLIKVTDNKFTVIYDPPFKEVKEIIIDSQNNIWIGCNAKVSEQKPTPSKEAPISVTPSVSVEVLAFSIPSETKEAKVAEEEKGSGIFKVNFSGVAKEIWSSQDEIIYSLNYFKKEDKIYFGTGPKGRLYAIDSNEKKYLVLQKDSESIYGVYDNYFITNNPAKLFMIESSQALEGEYMSEVIDAELVSNWGRISWVVDLAEGTMVQLMTRSGNKKVIDESWSAWSPPYKNSSGENILSPKGRFIQFRALLKSSLPLKSPILRRVEIFYLQANVPPLVKNIKVHPPHEVFQKILTLDEEILGYEKDKGFPEKEKVDEGISILAKTTGKKIYKKGFRTISWEAVDSNKDKISYSILLKEEKDKEWRVIRNDYTDTVISIDTFVFEDGIYRVKIVASDNLSNPPDLALQAEKVSIPFFIDNTPPTLQELSFKEISGKRQIFFTAKDNLTPIKEVYYSYEFGKWFVAFPKDGICDSPSEGFILEIPKDKKDIVLKVIDTLDNVTVIRKSF